MRFYDFPPEKFENYKYRIKQVKERHPDTHFPSQEARDYICGAIGVRAYDSVFGYAAILGDTKLCDLLKSKKVAKVNKKDYLGNTALMKAVERKRLGTAEWLLDHGAKILPNKDRWNPVLLACYQGCIPALNMFKHHGVDFTQPYSGWEWKKGFPRKYFIYPIEVALISNQAKAVRWLLNNAVNVNDPIAKGYFSIRRVFGAKPEYFTQEIQQILTAKILEESQKSVEGIQTASKSTHPPKRTIWQRLSFGRTKE